MAIRLSQPPAGKKLSREDYLEIIQTAINLDELQFARQLAINWLTKYPGDLPIKLLYANILFNEGHTETSRSILEEIIQVDPEFVDAIDFLLKLLQKHSATEKQSINAYSSSYQPSITLSDCKQWKLALGAEANKITNQFKDENQLPWGEIIYQINQSLVTSVKKDIYQSDPQDGIENAFLQVLALKANLPIVGITHLRQLKSKYLADMMPAQAVDALADHYYNFFPSCVQLSFFHAERLLDSSQQAKAVAIIHNCVASDVTGQVANRVWGKEHIFRKLWPQNLYTILDIPIPAKISAFYGWNQLPTGNSNSSIDNNPNNDENNLSDTKPLWINAPQNSHKNISYTSQISEIVIEAENINGANESKDQTNKNSLIAENIANDQPITKKSESGSQTQNSPILKQKHKSIKKTTEESIEIRSELERLSYHIKKPDLMQIDGRIPTYVVLTTRQGLENCYGQDKSSQIEKAALELVSAIRANKTWNALLFYADEGILLPANKALIKPARFNDPWSIKLALVDLDNYLAKFGEMIGAVLIVGGPEIVPFHVLPNPVDDADESVPSDNPYTTKDQNYFVPEWSIGRLPNGKGDNGSLIINALHEYTTAHQRGDQVSDISSSLKLQNLLKWFFLKFLVLHHLNGREQNSFGYTAAAWRNASFAVFQPVGEPKSMLISPPLEALSKIKKPKINGNKKYWQRGLSGGQSSINVLEKPKITSTGVYIPSVQYGYFNLHGLVNTVEWYGQSDLLEQDFSSQEQPDYPIALCPKDISSKGQEAPRLVFTEACYGAHISDKAIDQSIALSFLMNGCQAYVGSTCVSYGAITPPLTAADFLGYHYWMGLLQGLYAGESLRRAKIKLVREMNQEQGFLDGEDQKTLISFTLYGDPLARPLSTKTQAKKVTRPQRKIKISHTVCDHTRLIPSTQEISKETLVQVKRIVESYLPGMKNARMTLREEPISNCKKCRLLEGKNVPDDYITNPSSITSSEDSTQKQMGRKVVVLSKQNEVDSTLHTQYARLTLNEKGKVVKIVVSR